MSEQTSNLVEISALWKNTSKNGDTYLSGYMGSSKLLVLKNQFKSKDNEPDYRVYVAPNPKNQQRDETGGDNAPF